MLPRDKIKIFDRKSFILGKIPLPTLFLNLFLKIEEFLHIEVLFLYLKVLIMPLVTLNVMLLFWIRILLALLYQQLKIIMGMQVFHMKQVHEKLMNQNYFILALVVLK